MSGTVGAIGSDDFRRLQNSLSALVHDLRKLQNGLSEAESKKWTQYVAEVSAGKEYLKAPSASRAIVNELLVRPLEQIAKEAPTEDIHRLAKDFLNWYAARLP